MIIKPPVPRLDFLFNAQVEAGVPRIFGPVAAGERRVIDILGGRIEGPRLTGDILSDDGGLIYVQNRGLRHGPPVVMARMARGEPVGPAAYYFRSAPVFESAAPARRWMNSLIALCSAARTPDRVILDFYGVYFILFEPHLKR